MTYSRDIRHFCERFFKCKFQRNSSLNSYFIISFSDHYERGLPSFLSVIQKRQLVFFNPRITRSGTTSIAIEEVVIACNFPFLDLKWTWKKKDGFGMHRWLNPPSIKPLAEMSHSAKSKHKLELPSKKIHKRISNFLSFNLYQNIVNRNNCLKEDGQYHNFEEVPLNSSQIQQKKKQ